MSSTTFVMDSWAVLAYFQDEASADVVEELLADGNAEQRFLMTVVNMGEVWYTYARRISEEVATKRVEQLALMGIEFVDADRDLTLQAARYKAGHPIAYADCFAAALAHRERARLVTGDPEFRKLEDDLSILWI